MASTRRTVLWGNQDGSPIAVAADVSGAWIAVEEWMQNFLFRVKAENTAGSSPTLSAILEHSADEGPSKSAIVCGTLAFTTDTADKLIDEVDFDVKNLLPYVRVRFDIGGTGSPSYNVISQLFHRRSQV